MRRSLATAVWAGVVALCNGASAQSLIIQQPVVETFGVNTVVTVPDRGSVLLGSVSGARDSRTWNGFSPVGSSLGLDRNYSSARATVYIHDFAAMDEALLAEAAELRPVAARPANPLAASAYRQLQRSAVPRSDRLQPVQFTTPVPPQPTESGDYERPSVAAASRSTNSAVNPAASRASR